MFLGLLEGVTALMKALYVPAPRFLCDAAYMAENVAIQRFRPRA
jgi:hypothetical protein